MRIFPVKKRLPLQHESISRVLRPTYSIDIKDFLCKNLKEICLTELDQYITFIEKTS